MDTRFIDLIKTHTKPTVTEECDWDKYRMRIAAWQKKRAGAKAYMRSDRGRMSLAAISEQLGSRPSLRKINALASATDIELYNALIALQAYLQDKINLAQNITAHVVYSDLIAPSKIGRLFNGRSESWYQSNYA